MTGPYKGVFVGGGRGEENKRCTFVRTFCGAVDAGGGKSVKAEPGSREKILVHHFPKSQVYKKTPVLQTVLRR